MSTLSYSSLATRIGFLEGGQKDFIESAMSVSGYNMDQLASIAGVVPRSFRDWKREKYAITLEAANRFCALFGLELPESELVMADRWREIKRKASSAGAMGRIKKHGPLGTPEGRKKGGRRALRKMRQMGIIPEAKQFKSPAFSESLAEWVGIVLGDGSIIDSQVSISLNQTKDMEYVLYVKNLGEQLFDDSPRILHRDASNCTMIYHNGINLVKFLTSELGLKVGNKVKQQVDVPDWIKSNNTFCVACTRGLMDTDGGIFTHKYVVREKQYSYKKVCFSNRSKPLLHFVFDTLKNVGLTPKMRIRKLETSQVWLYNSNEIPSYLKLIGTSNLRLTRAYIS